MGSLNSFHMQLIFIAERAWLDCAASAAAGIMRR